MPDPTDAEIQAGADAIARSWRVLSPISRRHLAKLVLSAVLPDHDARVRADERRRVAEEIAELRGSPPTSQWGRGWHDAIATAAAIARQHAIEGDTGDDR